MSMALFNSVPAVSTQKDTAKPINRKPSDKVTNKDLETKKPLTEEEEDKLLKEMVKELDEEQEEPIYFEEEEEVIPKKEEPKSAPKPQPKKEEPKKESKPVQKVVLKPEVKKEEPKKEEAKPEPKQEVVKEEPKKEATPVVKEEAKQEVVENRPLTPEEKKARQMENLRKARLARQAQQEKENGNMATDKTKTQSEKPKKLVTEPKKAVDMSKMVMTTKKPQASTGGKTVYHVSKRGETREDRVWKVFIQESNKVIKLFDYQDEALEYAKQLAKNKNDGSYVILHGLNGKIRK